MELKPGYKRTEVGVIPEEWEVRTLRSLTTLLTNGFVGTATSAYIDSDEGVLYIQGYNIQEDGFNFHGIKRVSKSFHARNQKSCLQPGDLLTIQTGDIGVTATVPPALAGSNCHALVISRLDKRVSEPSFYCQYFNSERGRVAFKEIETGSTMKHLNVGDMKRLFLPSPPIEQQRAIAVALSNMNALLDALDQLIAKKSDLKQAAMQRLLSGEIRLPGFHEEWDRVRLGELFTFKNGLNKGKEFFGYGTPIVNYMDVFKNPAILCSTIDGRVSLTKQEIKNFNVKKGDVLFTRTSETPEEIGMASVILDEPDQAVFSGFVLRGRPKNLRLCDAFKAYCFRSAFVRNQIVSKASYTTRALTNGRILSAVLLPVPPLPEQTAIAVLLSDMDAEIAALEHRRDKTGALKQGMMQELLTGRTRLV
jgi:type I restriction enzyme, S subunit